MKGKRGQEKNREIENRRCKTRRTLEGKEVKRKGKMKITAKRRGGIIM